LREGRKEDSTEDETRKDSNWPGKILKGEERQFIQIIGGRGMGLVKFGGGRNLGGKGICSSSDRKDH